MRKYAINAALSPITCSNLLSTCRSFVVAVHAVKATQWFTFVLHKTITEFINKRKN